MLNLIDNWRYVGRYTKLIFFTINICFMTATLVLVASFQPELGGDMTKILLFSQMVKIQVISNIPLVIILNLSGFIKRTLVNNYDDE